MLALTPDFRHKFAAALTEAAEQGAEAARQGQKVRESRG